MFKHGDPAGFAAHVAITEKAKEATAELIALREAGKERAAAAKETEVRQMLWELIQLERDAEPWNPNDKPANS